MMFGSLNSLQNLIGNDHGHAAEVRNQMLTMCVASETTLRTFLRIPPSQRQQITTMATPVGTNVREIVEAMRNAVVDLLLVGVRLVVRLADAFRDDFWIAFCVARVFAVSALHAGRVLEEIPTKRTPHNIVELLLDEFVTLLFVHFFLLLSDSALTIETDIERTSGTCLLLKAHGEMNPARWFEREPRVNHDRLDVLRIQGKPGGRPGPSSVSRRHKRSRLEIWSLFTGAPSVGHFIGRNPSVLLKL